MDHRAGEASFVSVAMTLFARPWYRRKDKGLFPNPPESVMNKSEYASNRFNFCNSY